MLIYILEDDTSLRDMLETYFSQKAYIVKSFALSKDFLESNYWEADLLLLDIKLPDISGIDVLLEIKKNDNFQSPVVMMSAYADKAVALEAIRLGASDYIQKPFDLKELQFVIDKILEKEKLVLEKEYYRQMAFEEKPQFAVISESRAMKKILEEAQRVAPFKTSVLITGESGVGKEVLSRFIHNYSGRKDKPFVAINCGAIPSELMESELFGYEKGAFTGADIRKKGLLEVADGGTVFLDEIAELPVDLQVKLLRVLQDSTFMRVGGRRSIKVDIRVISATAKNLPEEIKKNRFREDLYFRLNVIHLHIPPLRERKEDIPALIDFFVEKFSKEFKKNVKGFNDSAMKLIMQHNWPGNVRELENMVERAVILCDKEYITSEYVQITKGSSDLEIKEETREKEDELEEILNEFVYSNEQQQYSIKLVNKKIEKYLIKKALTKTKGNVLQASNLLQISHRALIYKIRDYELEDFLQNIRKQK